MSGARCDRTTPRISFLTHQVCAVCAAEHYQKKENQIVLPRHSKYVWNMTLIWMVSHTAISSFWDGLSLKSGSAPLCNHFISELSDPIFTWPATIAPGLYPLSPQLTIVILVIFPTHSLVNRRHSVQYSLGSQHQYKARQRVRTSICWQQEGFRDGDCNISDNQFY